MSTQFTPDIGTFFYVESTVVYERVVGGGLFGDSATVVKERDRSYRGEVFKCTGRDDYAVVGANQTGSKRDVVLPRNSWAFWPVGPEVLAALNLEPDPAP